MPRRLVITNGDWTTRHEIGEADIVIGRDPNCDLFFVNQKLSRRHARFEPGPDGVRLVDLGSRNGVWVNEKKIDQHVLVPGDSIRLGGLRIVFEDEDADPGPELEGGDTTVLQGVDATVALSGTSPFAMEDTARWKQRDLESPEATVVHSRPPDQLGLDERTVVLPEADSRSGPGGTATVILGEGAGLEQPDRRDAPTPVLASSEASQGGASDEPILIPEPEPLVVRLMERWTALSWSTKLSVTLFGLSVLLGVLLLGPILAGSWVTGILLGLLFASLLARSATVLARKLLVEPVARLGRDADALESGDSLSLGREYPELDELARSVNRLTGRAPEETQSPQTE